MARPAPKPDGVVRRWVLAVTRPVAAHVVPLLVCLSLVPLLLLLSVLSGWYIWKSIPVAWQVPVYLQYGSVSFPPSSAA
jgi:hypothetical protein